MKEELNQEKATNSRLETDKQQYERQVKDLHAKLDEIENVVKAKQGML